MGVSSSIGSLGFKPGVCTSSSRPGAPYTGQVIYETDTGYLRVWDGAAWDYVAQSLDNWNMPRGLVTTTSGGTNSLGYKVIATQTINAGNTDDLTGSSMTFTAVSGRLYRMALTCYVASTSASGVASLYVTDASNNILGNSPVNITNSVGVATATISYIFTASGSTTRKLRVASTTGNNSFGSTNSTVTVTLEDIGPS